MPEHRGTTRLIDKIFTQEFLPPWYFKNMPGLPDELTCARMYGANIRQQLLEAQVIVADNVAEYLYASSDQEVWLISKHFPCLAPPFPSFWIECRRPSRIFSKEHGAVNSQAFPKSWGFLFQCSDFELSFPSTFNEAVQVSEKWLSSLSPERLAELMAARPQVGTSFERTRQWLENLPLDDARMISLSMTVEMAKDNKMTWEQAEEQFRVQAQHDKPKWEISASVVLEGKDAVIGPVGGLCLRLDSSGSVLHQSIQMASPLPEMAEAVNLSISSMVFAPLLAISFMHCQNVKMIPGQPDPKFNRVYEKKHGRPLLRYHTLAIEPMKEVLRREGRSEATGLQRALHICRGHFRTYTAERPMFGRITGRFWTPQHVRGSAERGTVSKDYEVMAP